MDRFEVTKKAGILGIVGNIFLLVIKSIVGFMSNSQSMIADAANSAGDIFASLMTFIGNKIDQSNLFPIKETNSTDLFFVIYTILYSYCSIILAISSESFASCKCCLYSSSLSIFIKLKKAFR